MAIGIIPFNHSNWYLYFRECPKGETFQAIQLGEP